MYEWRLLLTKSKGDQAMWRSVVLMRKITNVIQVPR
jgi:hypothetical protein